MRTKYILYIVTILILIYGHVTAQTRTLNTALPVGTTPGSAGVTETGAATYSIPIFVSPGTNGMQPNLSINYNSQIKDGLLGRAWGLGGLSAITRISANFADDSINDPVDFDSYDRFSLDGQRLVLDSGSSYGALGATYRTQMESFMKIFSYGKSGSGPAWFKAVTKNGMVMEFGKTKDSECIYYYDVLTWHVNKIIDPLGNYMTFIYKNLGGETYITKIEYTGNDTTKSIPYDSINFYYKRRNTPSLIFIGIAPDRFTNSKLLDKIKIFNGANLVREYNFSYTTGEDKLLEIVEKDKNGIQYNSTAIEWDNSTTQLSVKSSSLQYYYNHKVFYGDYNGDGRTDLFIAKKKIPTDTIPRWYLYTTNENGTTFTLRSSGDLPVEFQPDLTKVGDINSDGNE